MGKGVFFLALIIGAVAAIVLIVYGGYLLGSDGVPHRDGVAEEPVYPAYEVAVDESPVSAYAVLYVQYCTIGNVRDEDPRLQTLIGQVEFCEGLTSGRAGYYLQDIDSLLDALNQAEPRRLPISVIQSFPFPPSIYDHFPEPDNWSQFISLAELRAGNPAGGIDCEKQQGDKIFCRVRGGNLHAVIPSASFLAEEIPYIDFIPLGILQQGSDLNAIYGAIADGKS